MKRDDVLEAGKVMPRVRLREVSGERSREQNGTEGNGRDGERRGGGRGGWEGKRGEGKGREKRGQEGEERRCERMGQPWGGSQGIRQGICCGGCRMESWGGDGHCASQFCSSASTTSRKASARGDRPWMRRSAVSLTGKSHATGGTHEFGTQVKIDPTGLKFVLGWRGVCIGVNGSLFWGGGEFVLGGGEFVLGWRGVFEQRGTL